MNPKLRLRYMNEPRFHALVDAMVAHALHADLSQEELEDTVTVAVEVLAEKRRCKTCKRPEGSHIPGCPEEIVSDRRGLTLQEKMDTPCDAAAKRARVSEDRSRD